MKAIAHSLRTYLVERTTEIKSNIELQYAALCRARLPQKLTISLHHSCVVCARRTYVSGKNTGVVVVVRSVASSVRPSFERINAAIPLCAQLNESGSSSDFRL